jgi:glucosamine--fructose-6-phosphate aminotransferase (isomerizing)
VTVLSLLALWFRQMREDRDKLTEPPMKRELLEALQRLPISFGMALRSRDQCKKVAAELLSKNNLFVLGKGYGEPIAMEGNGCKTVLVTVNCVLPYAVCVRAIPN